MLNKKEKEELVIKLLNEGKTTRDIAQLAHVSLRDIGLINWKVTGDNPDDDDDSGEELVKNRKLIDKSYYAQSFQMFKQGKSLVEVAIELDLDANEVRGYYYDYLDLTNRKHLINIYFKLKDDFPLFLHLFWSIKEEGLNKQDITELLGTQNKLKEMEKRVAAATSLLASLNSEKLKLEKEIMEKVNLLYS